MHSKTQPPPAATRALEKVARTIRVLGIVIAVFAPKSSWAQAASVPEKMKGPVARILSVQTFSKAEEDEKLILATKTADDKWVEYGSVSLRSPFITSWFRVARGTTHLVKKQGDNYQSFGTFIIPEQSERFIVILIPDLSKNLYRTHVLDPQNLEFRKGKALFVNYAKIPAIVVMGKSKLSVKPGQQVVEPIVTDADGMYPLAIGYMNESQKFVPCYDKRVSSNRETRKFILLFPDQDIGLRAISLSEFGPFE